MSIVLSIIIVNYNAKNVLRNCLKSITDSNFSFPFEVTIIDNASNESIAELVMEFPFIQLIVNEKNYGFASANNRSIAKAKGKYIVLLNPDTIVNSESFLPMITYLENHDNVGIVGCKIFNAEGDVEHSTHSFPTLMKEFVHANELLKTLVRYDTTAGRLVKKLVRSKSLESYWNHDSEREVDHVTGACMMVRKDAINKVGLLDEAFFLYNEEVEWSYRMNEAGYKSIFLPQSNIIHLFGYSTKQQVQRQVANKLLVERYRGMLYFFQKHYSFWHLAVLRLIVVEGFLLRLVFRYVKVLTTSKDKQELLQEIRYIKKIMKLAFASNFDWRKDV
jgi:GT2 family glycosyltransferase